MRRAILTRRNVLLLVLFGLVLGILPGVVGAQAELTVTSPQSDATIDGTSVTVEFEASEFSIVRSDVPLDEAGQRPEANVEGEGHVHIMLDLMPIIVWESAEPYTINDVPPGEHTLMVELVNNDHSPLATPVVQEIRFSTNADQVLSNTGSPQEDTNWTYPALLMVAGVLVLGTGLVLRRKIA